MNTFPIYLLSFASVSIAHNLSTTFDGHSMSTKSFNHQNHPTQHHTPFKSHHDFRPPAKCSNCTCDRCPARCEACYPVCEKSTGECGN